LNVKLDESMLMSSLRELKQRDQALHLVSLDLDLQQDISDFEEVIYHMFTLEGK